MAELPEQEDREGRFPEQGRVKNVANQWRVFEDEVIANQLQNQELKNKWAVYEDGAMAHVMQQEEFEHKYGMNRFHRRTVREDIPVARVVQTAEEEERQRKEMLRLERQKQIADEDERIAREMANNLQLQADTEQLQRQLKDEERTRQLLQEEDENLRQDEELARQLQEREKEKFERKRLERERRKLEQQIANERVEAERLLAAYRQEVQAGHHDNQHNIATESLQNGAPPDRLLRADGKVEDMGDFTDFYNIPEHEDDQNKKILQQVQDEELARLLQEQEHKRGGHLKLDKLKAIELQDAELARVMQDQEKLKERKRKQKRLEQKQMSERHRQHSGEDHSVSYQRSRSVDDYHSSTGGSGNFHPAHRDPNPNHHHQHHHHSQQSQHRSQHGDHSHQHPADPNHHRHPHSDPRDEDLYEQPWTSIPRMQAPPVPANPPPARSHHAPLGPPEDDSHHGYGGHNHARQSSRDSYESADSGAGSPTQTSPYNTNTNSNMEGPTTYKPVTSNSPNNNLFADIDPTLQRAAGYDVQRRQEPEPQQPLPDLQLSAQRMPVTEEENKPPQQTNGRKGAGSPGDEQYAEVGDFSPVAGQRRNTIPKKGKEKKASSKNKNSNCKQQ